MTGFDTPMESDRGDEDGGGHDGERGIKRDFVGFVPEARLGVLVPGEPGHPSDGGDEAVPPVAELSGDVEGFDQAVLLPAVPVAVDGVVPVEGGWLAQT